MSVSHIYNFMAQSMRPERLAILLVAVTPDYSKCLARSRFPISVG